MKSTDMDDQKALLDQLYKENAELSKKATYTRHTNAYLMAKLDKVGHPVTKADVFRMVGIRTSEDAEDKEYLEIPDNVKELERELAEEQRIQTENDAAAKQALKVLREVLCHSRDRSPLPRDVFNNVVTAAMELSRCGFEEE